MFRHSYRHSLPSMSMSRGSLTNWGRSTSRGSSHRGGSPSRFSSWDWDLDTPFGSRNRAISPFRSSRYKKIPQLNYYGRLPRMHRLNYRSPSTRLHHSYLGPSRRHWSINRSLGRYGSPSRLRRLRGLDRSFSRSLRPRRLDFDF